MDSSNIITYEKIYEIRRLEKYKKEVQKLDANFSTMVLNYLKEKEAILEGQKNKDSIFASQSISKTNRQLENAKALLRDLYETREGKIIQIALFNSRTGQRLQEIDAFLEEEFKFYIELVTLLNIYRDNTLNRILNGNLPNLEFISSLKPNYKIEDPDEKNVKFLKPIPTFVAEDMKSYGPFNVEDEARLPIKVCEALIKNSIVEEV